MPISLVIMHQHCINLKKDETVIEYMVRIILILSNCAVNDNILNVLSQNDDH